MSEPKTWLVPLDTTVIVRDVISPDGDGLKKGIVVSVGPGYLRDNGTYQKIAVEPDDRILFGDYAQNVVKVDGRELTIIHESEIIAIIHGDGRVE